MSVNMNPSAYVTATAATNTGTTAKAFPEASRAAWDFKIINRGAVELLFKKGPSSGPDANSTSDAWVQIPVPPLTMYTFSRSQDDTHFYVYAGSSCVYTVLSGSGE